MKARKTLPLLLAVLALTACKYDDSALWEQLDQNKEYIAASERIAALEVWQAKTNTNIQSTQTLLGLSDYITAVTPVTEAGVRVGYTITFLNSPAITIYNDENGVAGITPQIGITQEDDDNWYWTLNGDLLTDGEGSSIQANGDSAPMPQLSTGASLTVSQDFDGSAIVDDAIYLSVDDGETWTRVSGEDGSSFFSDVDTSDATCVTFTLSDGASFSIARYTGLKLTFDRSAVRLGYGNSITVDFHKMFLIPISASALLVKDGTELNAFQLHTDYLNREEDEEEGFINLVGKSMQTTRRFDALKVYMAFRMRGRDGYRKIINTMIDNASYFFSCISRDDEFIAPVKPELSSVVFALKGGDDRNRNARKKLMSEGTIIGQTVYKGKVMLKFTLLNPSLTKEHIDGLIERIRRF